MLAVELFVIARQQVAAIVKTSSGVTYLEMSHDNIASDIPPNASRTPISMPELGAGPQQTQSTTCVCEGGQPSTPGHRDPPQSKKQKTEAELCGASNCASLFVTSCDAAHEDIGLAVSDTTAASLGDPHASVPASAQPAETSRGSHETTAVLSTGISAPIQCVTLEYTDVFLGRKMCILFSQRSQIERPLKLIKSLTHLFLRSSGLARTIEHRQVLLSPFESMHVEFWQVQRVRAIFGFTAQACCRLAMTLTSLKLAVRAGWRWKTRMIVRVLSGFCGKIQVPRHARASVCAFRSCSWSHYALYSHLAQQTRDDYRVRCPLIRQSATNRIRCQFFAYTFRFLGCCRHPCCTREHQHTRCC